LLSFSDLADSYSPGQLKPLFASPWVEDLFKEVKSQRGISAQTREVAKWAKEMVCTAYCRFVVSFN
jgi:hypothetical protein